MEKEVMTVTFTAKLQEAEDAAEVTGADGKDRVRWEIIKELKENKKGSLRNHSLRILLNPLVPPHSSLPSLPAVNKSSPKEY